MPNAMTCEEFKEHVGAAALGALDPEDRVTFEAHLGVALKHPECLAALRNAERAAQLIAYSVTPVAPSGALWGRIESSLGLENVNEVAPASVTRMRRVTESLGWMAAAAAILIAVVAYRDQAVTARRAESLQAALQTLKASAATDKATLDLLVDPATQIIPLGEQKDGVQTAVAFVNFGRKQGYVLGQSFVPEAGKDYQLWVIRDGKPADAGVMKIAAGGSVLHAIPANLLESGKPDAFAVTVEPTGGLPQPSGPVILLGKPA